MPIKSLESFLFERKLVSTSSVEILQNATIGIDVEHYLGRIYTYKKEQLLSGIGGVPISLRAYIQSDLDVFSEFNIRPIFVIPGLPIASQSNTQVGKELTAQEQHRESVWNRIQTKTNNAIFPHINSNESFRYHAEPLPFRPMVNELINCFIEADIDYFICPYDASFQLSFMYQNHLIDSIYGSTDVLLTHVDKFILGMEFQSKDFRFVDKRKFLTELDLTERQFIDISLMIGCSVQPHTFHNLPKLPKSNPLAPFPQPSYFKIGLDIVYQLKSFGSNIKDLYGYISSFNDPKLMELYFKGHAAIKYMPVMNVDGYVDLYFKELAELGISDPADLKNSEVPELENVDSERQISSKDELKVPVEIHDIISQRLPPELYLYFSLGLISSTLLEAITHGTITVRPPIEGGSCETFKELVSSAHYKSILENQLNLLTQLLARYYQVKKVKLHYWFRTAEDDLNIRLLPPTFVKLQSFKYRASSAPFLLKYVFQALPALKFMETESSELADPSDILFTAIIRAFYLHDIADPSGLKPRSLERVLSKFIEASENVEQKDLELLFLLLLLLSTKSGRNQLSPETLLDYLDRFKDKSHGEELSSREKQKINLLSRVLSLGKFDIQAINYQGPLSRSLLAFRSHVEFVHNTILNSIEVCLIDFVARQSAYKISNSNRSHWYDLIKSMPFFGTVNNTLLGVMGEIYFEYCLKLEKLGNKELQCSTISSHYLLEEVLQLNNVSHNINLNSVNAITKGQFISDIKSGLNLWNGFYEVSSIAAQEDPSIINSELFGLIRETHEMVQKFKILS